MEKTDVRLSPIMTPARAAALIGRPAPQVRRWARPVGRHRALVTTTVNDFRGWPTIPLIGLAEAHTVGYLREMGWSMHKVQRFADFLREQTHESHAFARPKYVTDGFDMYVQNDDELIELFTSQGAFLPVLEKHLKEIVPWDDDLAGAYRPAPMQGTAEIDPRYNGGRLSFLRTRVPLFAIAGALDSGDELAMVQADYDLTDAELQLAHDQLPWLREVA